jgi:hypothetical protein
MRKDLMDHPMPLLFEIGVVIDSAHYMTIIAKNVCKISKDDVDLALITLINNPIGGYLYKKGLG